MDILSAVRHKMLISGDGVLVAVSGGPDSVAMLHALHARSADLAISLHVAHLNHGIRGDQSNLDEAFVCNLAHESRLPITVGHVDVPAMRAEQHIGEEEAARIARHRFLRGTAESVGANKIAIAHTADDRAETILLNILRGCGVDGLGAMRPVDGMIVRPLIETSRREVEQYIAEHALPYRIDETNADITYARNRVRHKVIPLLEREFNPEVKSALVRLGEIAASQSDLVEELAESSLQTLVHGEGLDAGLFANLPRALQFQIARSEVMRLKGDLADVTFEQIERIVDAVCSGEEFTFTLPSGRVYASRKAGILRFYRAEETARVTPFDHALSVPGTTLLPEVGLRLECSVTDKPTVRKLAPEEATIDAESIVGTLHVRNIKRGDRIVPLGMTGTKKLQDVFVDKKIPRGERARAAVICDGEKILWVVGVVSSELGKVLPTSRAALHLIAVHDR
jgi:tRNA(Ile)-lysidine synthase